MNISAVLKRAKVEWYSEPNDLALLAFMERQSNQAHGLKLYEKVLTDNGLSVPLHVIKARLDSLENVYPPGHPIRERAHIYRATVRNRNSRATPISAAFIKPGKAVEKEPLLWSVFTHATPIELDDELREKLKAWPNAVLMLNRRTTQCATLAPHKDLAGNYICCGSPVVPDMKFQLCEKCLGWSLEKTKRTSDYMKKVKRV